MSDTHRDDDTNAVIETSESLKQHPTRSELYAYGKSLRDNCPRQSHSAWHIPSNRPNPVQLLVQSNEGRIQDLVPIRHGRMLKSPFAYYRGSALNMASDLASTPASSLIVQACGDCHLMNFGSYATPERRVIFDINDLDETLRAPWEWDLKRLTTSFVLACRDNGFDEACARDAVLACVRSYREHMAEFSEMTVLDIWYASIDADLLIKTVRDEESRQRMKSRLEKARARSVLEHEFPELVTNLGVSPSIRENPPLIYHPREKTLQDHWELITRAFERYRSTMSEERRSLLDRFKLVDSAIKVVGVGSVGTYCGILLLMAHENDPLFLQFKQARPSVLEPYVGPSQHKNHGERIVHGCRMMQSASDLFLGWTEGEEGRHFYVRQLKDMKIKPLVELFTPSVMIQYAEICGWTLAHAHARSGEPTKMFGYMGKSDKFDRAISEFSVEYANQVEKDYETVVQAARHGKIEVFVEEEA